MATKKKAAPPPKAKPEVRKSKSPTEARSSKSDDGDKPKKVSVNTPPGRFSYPYFSEPDSVSRGEFKADNKYKARLLVDKKVWKSHPDTEALKAACLKAAQKKWGKNEITDLKDLDLVPWRDTDSGKRKVAENVRGCVEITAKSAYQPTFIGARKNDDGDFDELTEKQVKALKGGDWGRFRVGVATFTLKGERGVNLYLNLVQFQQEGESLGDGASAAIDAMDEMEVTLDDYEDEESEEETEEDDKPVRGRKGAKKASRREEDEDESDDDADSESDDDDDQDEDEKPSRKSKRSRDEDEDDDAPDERPRRRSNGKDTHYDF